MQINHTLGRRAGYTLAAVLGAFLVLNTYWALGGTWGMQEALGGHTAPPSILIWAQELAVLAGIVIVLARAAILRLPAPRWLLQLGIWAMVAVFGGVAVLNLLAQTTLERLLFAPLALMFTALAVAVACSPEREWTAATSKRPLPSPAPRSAVQ